MSFPSALSQNSMVFNPLPTPYLKMLVCAALGHCRQDVVSTINGVFSYEATQDTAHVS